MELQPHQQRVLTEKAELDEKLEKLKAFIGTDKFCALGVHEMHRLQRQANHMADYSAVLGERMAAFR